MKLLNQFEMKRIFGGVDQVPGDGGGVPGDGSGGGVPGGGDGGGSGSGSGINSNNFLGMLADKFPDLAASIEARIADHTTN